MRKQAMQVTSPAPRAVWEDLLSSDPEALPSQTPAWLDCVCASSAYEDASRLYEAPGGRQFVLPMVRRKLLLGGVTIEESMPFAFGRGGIVAPGTARVSDIAAVFSDLARRPVLRTSLRPSAIVGDRWATAAPHGVVAVPRLAHVLDLEGGFGRVWNKVFKSSTRNKIRKAEQSGLVVECDTTGRLVPVFYNLLSKSFDRWARQQHEPRFLAHWRARQRDPLRKFQDIAKVMGDSCKIWVAWLNGKAAASIIMVQCANAHYLRGAMDKEIAGPSRANDLLQRMAIEDACQAGCRYYYMDESGESARLANFKRRFGGVAYPYFEYHLERLPITKMDGHLRTFMKRLIGFQDA